MLATHQLHYQINHHHLINDINLEIKSGELVVIIGPNGAGKSTLLRLLTGFLKPTNGECQLLDRSLSHWNHLELSKVRAMMRQQCDMTFPFTAKEVIAMGRAPYGKNNFKQALDNVIEKTHCQSLCDKDYRLLSGGEQQRVQLARVLAQLWQAEPTSQLLFLDEPTSALDLYHQQQMLRLLHHLTRTEPIGVCCILHDLNLTALYADRIFLIHQGQLVAQGSPKAVLSESLLTKWYQADITIQNHPNYQIPQIHLIR